MTDEYDPFANWTIEMVWKAAREAEDAAAANLRAFIRMREALERSMTRLEATAAELERRTGTFDAVNEIRKAAAADRAALAWEYRRAGRSAAQIAPKVGLTDGSSVRRLLRKFPES
jgi:hypothetical protein